MKQQAREWRRQAQAMALAASEQPDGYTQLVEQMASGDFMPGWALEQAGPCAIPTLIAGLSHPHTRVRRGCVDTIDHGGYGGDVRCIEALLPLLHDRVPHIRRAVWHTLFCERCRDDTKCEIAAAPLDQVALLIEIGMHDPNPKLRRQLVADLGEHVADSRARQALEAIVREESDPELVAVAQRALCSRLEAV